jgi:beta-lactam-binding protein with PASTA domain
MEKQSFLKKLTGKHLWGNLLAMLLIIFLISLGLKYGLELYTRHGQSVEMPDIVHKSFEQAEAMLDSLDLNIEVSDTDFVKSLPPDCILEQSIAAGDIIKPDRVVYVKINAAHSPSKPIPDIVDNSSLRDAQNKLTSLGFKLGDPEYVPGERDWVYGLKCRGRSLFEGDMVSTEDVLTIQVGDGRRNLSEEVTFTQPTLEDTGIDNDAPKRPRPRPKKTESETKSGEGASTPAPAPAPAPAAPAPSN